MRKILPFLTFFLLTGITIFAQVSISADNIPPDPSAMLDVKSANKGVLIPRLSFEQRNAIATPAEGLMIFCTDCGTNGALSIYSNGTWRTFSNCNSIAPAAGTHAASQTQVTWNWEMTTDASGYKWSIDNNYGTATDLGTSTTMTETGLECNTSYSRYVWAYYNCGTSNPTTLVQSTLSFPDPPLAGIHAATTAQITWNWEAAAGATGYRWNTVDDINTATDLGMVISVAETGLNCNTLYTRYLWAYNVCGNSSPAILTQVTQAFPFPPAEGIHVPSVTGIIWNWLAVPEAAGYKWNSTNDYNTATDMAGILYMDETGLACNTSYTRYVWAYNACGNSIATTLMQSTSICPVLPDVSTTDVTAITQTTASGGGNVTSDGGATVTEYGVCWSTAINPTIAGSHTSDGSGTGGFVSNLTGLAENTLYYLRAFATNSVGTAYGNQVSFTTLFAGYSVRVLVVGGGGGGSPSLYSFPGSSAGGGGGAGGYSQNPAYSITNTTPINVTVGFGGSGSYPAPANGTNSVFGIILSCGGFCTAGYNGASACNGISGGPGTYWGAGGGGGGFAGPGSGNSGTSGGYGGNGVYNDISGSMLPYSGGGGGGASGGAQGLRVSTYGGGGYGANNSGGTSGGNGQNGIVIVRYTSPVQRGTGGVVTTIGGDYIHTFTSYGTFTPY